MATPERERWRSLISDALGDLGRVVTDVIPHLEKLIGQQPEVAHLPPAEEEQRFRQAFLLFVAVFCRKENPLVVFLDDLQWADAGTLSLLEHCKGLRYSMFILAYRSNEVPPEHALSKTLDRMKKIGSTRSTRIACMDLLPLRESIIVELLIDMLACCSEDKRSEISSLAKTVHKKTEGNPFFVQEFLKSLRQDGLMWFDWDELEWKWNQTHLKNAAAAENVVELLVRCIGYLPRKTRNILIRCAFIGNKSPTKILAEFCGSSVEAIASDIYEALEADYLFYDEDSDEYVFSHDRVQQAAYSLCSSDYALAYHGQIGLLFYNHFKDMEDETPLDQVFDMVRHVNEGI